MSLEIKVNDGLPDRLTIYVKSGAETNVLWLSPDFIDFDKRVSVQLNGRPVRIFEDDGETKFSAFLRPSIRTILDDFRVRGDRQRLYYVRLPL